MRPRTLLRILAALCCAASAAVVSAGSAHAENRTYWSVRTSEGFDALCAVNLLSGDPYYLEMYPADSTTFAEPRYERARRAAASLKAVIKDEQKGIISAFLTLIFSGGPDSTLAAVIGSANAPKSLETSFRGSAFASEESWRLFERVRPQVVEVLEAMRDAGFDDDWRARMGATGAARAESLRVQLARYDVLGEQGRLVGHALQNGRIDVILLYYSMPHGIRVQGSRFLTNVGYPLDVVLRNAAHEPLHPSFDAGAPDVRAAIDRLARDSLLARIVRTHDPAFGYTSLEGLVDEDAVQALEQVVSEHLGIAEPARSRWRESDDGMHVLAAAIYSLMQDTGFDSRGGRFERWFVAAVKQGRLSPAEIRRRAAAVLGDDVIRKWAGESP